jgi:hypothetical protein
MNSNDTDRILSELKVLGDPPTWKLPDGYHQSVGLSILDSIWSMGVNYHKHVVPVVCRYRAFRIGEGADPEKDSADDLVSVFARVGSVEEFIGKIARNRQRTSTSKKNSILKARAVLLAAQGIQKLGLATPADVVRSQDAVEAFWLTIKGQGSGISFGYFMMLLGQEGIKPDRMIIRFLEKALDRKISPDEARELLAEVARKLNLSQIQLDHAIWNYQRGRKYLERKIWRSRK